MANEYYEIRKPIEKRDSQRTGRGSVGWGHSCNSWCSGRPNSGRPNANNNYEADDE